MEDEIRTREELLGALLFTVQKTKKLSQEKALNGWGLFLMSRATFARYMDCVRAGYEEEAKRVLESQRQGVPEALAV